MAAHLADWWLDNTDLVRGQVRLREDHFGFPRSNGATEHLLDWIDGRLPRTRRFRLRNANRLRGVLALMRAEQAGQADAVIYAALVKREMGRLTRDEHLAWGTGYDRASEISSLGALIVAAHARKRAGTTAYMTNAKVTSVLALVAEEHKARAVAGLPPLAVSGSRTPSVDVAGLRLADFPRVLRDSGCRRQYRRSADVLRRVGRPRELEVPPLRAHVGSRDRPADEAPDALPAVFDGTRRRP